MRKLIRIIPALLLSAVMALGMFVPVMAEDKEFEDFLKEEFNKIMLTDYTEFHFNVIDYQKYDIPKPEVWFGEMSYESLAAEAAWMQESLDRLHQFDFDALDDRQQHDYLAYESFLEENILLDSFPDYQECYNPYNGLYENVVITFTEFVLYNRESADDYLTLLQDYPRILAEMDEFTKQQAAKGHFMRDAVLDETLASMQEFIDKGEENPLIVIFSKNIDNLEGLSEEEKTSYKDRCRDLVLNTVFPAITKTRGVLESLRGSRSVTGSVFDYEDGRAYYEALANLKCSDKTSLDEKRDYLAKCSADLISYSMSHFGNPYASPDFKTPEEILAYLGQHLEDFPPGPEVHYTPSYLDPSVANPSVGAYYVQPPLDNVTENVIRINGENVQDSISDLYVTLSHEGLPGHMYQFTWYYSQPDTAHLRHMISAIGYSEGWAQYVERIMLLRSPLNPADAEYQALNVMSGYAFQAYCDILINGYGYDAAKLTEELKKIGMDMEEEYVQDIVDICSDAPGMILPYGYGMCKMWEYNERVHGSLGDDFNLEEFHLQILKNGMRSFEIVESDLQKYVEGKGREFMKDFTLFTYSATEESTAGIVDFIASHFWILIVVVLVLIILALVLLFFLIRFIYRKITGKEPKKKKRKGKAAEEEVSNGEESASGEESVNE